MKVVEFSVQFSSVQCREAERKGECNELAAALLWSKE
jgi:hypothetical protein